MDTPNPAVTFAVSRAHSFENDVIKILAIFN